MADDRDFKDYNLKKENMAKVTVTFDLDNLDDVNAFKTYTRGVAMEIAICDIRQIFHNLKHNEEIDRQSKDSQYIFDQINEIITNNNLDDL